MTPTHTPANDNRPKEFDTLLLSHHYFIIRECRKRDYYMSQDDLYQELIARALSKWQRYKPEGSFSAWLVFLICEINQQYRKKNRHVFVDPDDMAPAAVTPPNQEWAVGLAEVLRLPPMEASAVCMKAIGYTGAEIAEMRGCTVNEVFHTIYHGQRMLRAANDNVKQDKKAA